jgi:hypothetical protein
LETKINKQKDDKMSMTIQQKKGLGLLGAFVFTVLGTRCKTETDPTPTPTPTPTPVPTACECPNGTNHPDDPCGCKADDCVCTNNPVVVETPELREATIDLDFSSLGRGTHTATIEGTLTVSEWTGFTGNIDAIFKKSIGHITIMPQLIAFMGVFDTNKAVIVVEKGAPKPYDIIHKHLIHFDFDYLVELSKKSEEEIAATFIDIVMEMDEAPFPNIAKVKAAGGKTVIADNARKGWTKMNKLYTHWYQLPLFPSAVKRNTYYIWWYQRAKSKEQRTKYLTAR